MFAVLKKIMVFVLLAVFLLAFAGITVTKHTCASCQTTMYYIIAHTDCCDNHQITHTQEAQSCCSSHFDEDLSCNLNEPKNCEEKGCCHQEYMFIKVNDNFVVNQANLLPKNIMVSLLSAFVNPIDDALEDIEPIINLKKYRPPPLLPEGAHYFKTFCQLIFYA